MANRCEHCKNSYDEDFDHSNCGVIVDGEYIDLYTPRTNADRIRSMSDEELAEFIANDCLELSDKICGGCKQEDTTQCGNYCCIKHIIEWLKQEES